MLISIDMSQLKDLDIPPERVEQAVDEIVRHAYDFWRDLAESRLNRSKSEYLSALTFSMSGTGYERTGEITVEGSGLAEAVEFGTGQRPMKSPRAGLLANAPSGVAIKPGAGRGGGPHQRAIFGSLRRRGRAGNAPHGALAPYRRVPITKRGSGGIAWRTISIYSGTDAFRAPNIYGRNLRLEVQTEVDRMTMEFIHQMMATMPKQVESIRELGGHVAGEAGEVVQEAESLIGRVSKKIVAWVKGFWGKS